MAISFASAPGNLFNRLGKCGLLLSELRTHQNNQNTNMTNATNGLVAQFDAEPDIQALVGSSYLGVLSSVEGVGSLAKNIAEQTINRMVYRDNPRTGQNLQSMNVLDSIREVIRQMKVAGATVQSATVTATIGTISGTGNGILNASVRRPSDGLIQENSFAETILLTCSNDSYVGSATAGNEGFTAKGQGSETDVFAFDWPLGSNITSGLTAIDGNSDNSAGNKLTNSGFTNFTSNVPNNWTLVLGAGGTNVFQENSIVYDSSGSSLRIAGDSGGTLTNLTQTFDLAAGTAGTLDAVTQYSFNIFARRDGTAAAAGVITIDLIDGTNTVINDANGVANSFTIDLTTLSTNWASFTAIFRTPYILPSTIKIRMRLTTALTNGRSVYLDKASLGIMSRFYIGGPSLAVHSGSAPFIQGDFGTVVIANNRGGATNLASFQPLFARLFAMRENNLMLPTSSTPSIADALIG